MRRSKSTTSPPSGDVARTLRGWLESRGARDAGFEHRKYQTDAAARCYRGLCAGRNVVLPLPTGTGKTLISNLVTRLWLEAKATSNVLVVLPRRVLVSQHTDYAEWMADAVEFYRLSDSSVQSPVRFAANSAKSRLLFTTPDLFANKVRSGLITPVMRKTIGLVIVDEFDEFLLPEYSTVGCVCRFDLSFQNFLNSLPKKLPKSVPKCTFLLMSATSPLVSDHDTSINSEVKAASQRVRTYFNPTIVSVPSDNYRNHVPVTRLKLHAVHDSTAERLDQAVSDEIFMLLCVLEQFHTGTVDRPWVLTRIDGLAEGRITKIRKASGKMLPIGTRLVKLFERVRQFHYLRSFVYEDMCAGLDGVLMDYTVVTDPVSRKRVRFPNRIRLQGLIRGFEHHPRLGGKAEALFGLAKTTDKIVLLFRYIRLLEAIAEHLSKARRRFVVLHGDMKDRQREASLREFREGSVNLLLMTRDTGKRGLDLPQARSAVFYSPKASETSTFQEASRIRSTTGNVKTSHILCYTETDERQKLSRLVNQIKLRRDREYQILDPYGLLAVNLR